MAVVGVDIGDSCIHISVACLGGVETIANDYSLRATPTVVALTQRQRFVGVAAESQRSLHPRNTVSHFKNLLARPLTAEAAAQLDVGALVKRDDAAGQLMFELPEGSGRYYSPEQVMAMMFTKIKQLVAAAAADGGSDQANIETCVVSVPIYFTHAQRLAMRDAAAIAGLRLDAVVTDVAALALAYGKAKADDLPPEPHNNNNSELQQQGPSNNNSGGGGPRYVVLVDCGAEGSQAALLGVTRERATVLASTATRVGGKVFDRVLRDHMLAAIRDKYNGADISGNARALNKLSAALEKVKKQMSANANRLPFTVDSLLGEDRDVQLSAERAEFEQLLQPSLALLRQSWENLLASTTVRREQIHSVELVGGSSRLPAIRALAQEVFGAHLCTSLNADEAVSRGCALWAAALSARFITRRFEVRDAVLLGVEAVFVHGGVHERALVYDEGDSAAEERRLEIEADLPLNIALQYAEEAVDNNKFIALYQVKHGEAKSGGTFELRFGFDAYSTIELREVALLNTKDIIKRRRTASESVGPSEQQQESSAELSSSPQISTSADQQFGRTSLPFTRSVTAHSGLGQQQELADLARLEADLVAADRAEVARQEERNRLEEELYKVREQVAEREAAGRYGEQLAAEETTQRLRTQLEELEQWLYSEEEGEWAPIAALQQARQQLAERSRIYALWCDKFVAMKAKEEERQRYIEQQQQQQRGHREGSGGRSATGRERQIPVVYEGRDGGYVPKAAAGPMMMDGREGRRRSEEEYPAGGPHSFPGSGRGFPSRRRGAGTFPRGDPFRGFGPNEFFDPMFGW
jgi:heat shock protein